MERGLSYYEELAHVIVEAESLMTCRPQAGAPGKPVVEFQSKLKAWEPEETNSVIPAKSKCPREKMDVPTQATNKFSLLPPSVLLRPSINWRISSETNLLSLPIQMLISSGNTLTDIPGHNVLLGIWHPLAQSK